MDKKLKNLINLIYPAAAIAVILIFWSILYVVAGSEYIFPSVGSVLKKISDYLSSLIFWQSLSNTLLRVITSFAVAFILSACLGGINYFYPIVGRVAAPFVKIMISAPTVAIMIIFNMMMVKRSLSPIFVSLTIVFPMTYASVNAALSQIDKKLLEMAKIYKVPRTKVVFSLVLPSVLPYLIEQTGTIISFTLKVVVSAEIIANTYKSVGGILQQANVYIDLAGVMATTVISVVVAIILEFMIKILVKLSKGRKAHD